MSTFRSDTNLIEHQHGGGPWQAHQLFGREKTAERLLSIFKKTSRGYGQLLLVGGHSGIGKTSVIEWLKEPVQARNGIFIQGKFDQYQQHSPYFPIRHALSSLWKAIQGVHGRESDQFNAELREKLGEHGTLLFEIIPEIREVLRIDTVAEEISPLEAQHRFVNVIRTFLQVAARPERPLVMFIDDWQWADNASLEFLRTLLAGSRMNYFLLIASYRDEDVHGDHPLLPVINELDVQISPPEKLEVKNLSEQDVRQLIGSILPGEIEDLDGLTAMIREITGGNPFYTISFLEFLHETRSIYRDTPSPVWKWRIDTQHCPDDIVELFLLRLKLFKADTRDLVSFAACLGNRFSLKNLESIRSLRAGDSKSILSPLVRKGLLLQKGPGSGEEERSLLEYEQDYAFLHDRVQQAAFLLIEPGRISSIHLQIGRTLFNLLSRKAFEEKIYEVAGHLNQAYDLITDAREMQSIVELNMEAAGKAEGASAYRAALEFYRSAYRCAELLSNGFAHYFDSRYDIALQLSRSLARSEFLEGDVERAERIVLDSLKHTKTPVERAETLNIMIVHYTLTARYEEAIDTGRRALGPLNIHLPESDFETHRDKAISECLELLNGRPVNSLYDSEFMQNQRHRTAAKLLITLGPPCYRTHQRLWSVIVPTVVKLTLQHGLIPQIGYSHTAFGGLLGWVKNDYAMAREFGELAERVMVEKIPSRSDRSVFYLMIGSSIRHWFHHLSEASRDYMKAYEIGQQSGNMQYAAYAFGHNMYCSFYQAIPIEELCRISRQYLIFSRTRLNQWAIDLLEGGMRLFKGLASGTGDAVYGEGADADYISQVNSHGNVQVLCIYHVLKANILMLLGRFEEAYGCACLADKDIYTVGTQGLLPWPEHVFCRFLIISALYPEGGGLKRAEWHKTLDQDLTQLSIWAEHGPDNYRHKFLLAKAEMARISGRASAALLYDQAIEAAHAGGFLQYEGTANERASLFWQQQGNETVAQVYWREAYICFNRWGAHAKLRSMEQEYAEKLQGWLTATGCTAAENEITTDHHPFVARHLELLQNQSREKLEAEFHKESSHRAEELTLVTEKLREEVAERKRLEDERSKLEEEIRHTRKMEAIGTLAGGIAHEFNNMLAIIIGNIELAQDDLPANEATEECFEEIRNASLRAKEVVKKLHRFARKIPTAKEPVQIKIVIEEILSLLRKTIPSTVEFRFISTCDREMVLADPTELNQVLINLCNNSVHAMKGQGVVEIVLEQARIDADSTRRATDLQPGRYVRLVVTDTGCGIGADILSRVFDPYFTTKDVDEGLGMGLAVVQGIVKSYDGDITIRSKVGKGTKVIIMLPLLEDADGQASAADPDSGADVRKRILFVDDEDAIVSMNLKRLRAAGYLAEGTTSPLEAVERLKRQPGAFDLLITDMTMPKMTGAQLLAEVKKIRPDIPAIISTGHTDLVDEEGAREMGAAAFLSKPFEREELLDTIAGVLEERSESR